MAVTLDMITVGRRTCLVRVSMRSFPHSLLASSCTTRVVESTQLVRFAVERDRLVIVGSDA